MRRPLRRVDGARARRSPTAGALEPTDVAAGAGAGSGASAGASSGGLRAAVAPAAVPGSERMLVVDRVRRRVLDAARRGSPARSSARATCWS